MKNQLQDDHQLFTSQIFKQIEHLPLLLDKCSHLQKETVSLAEIREFVEDIEVLLVSSGAELDKQFEKLANEQGEHEIVDDFE